MKVEFEISGGPVGKGRPRFARAGNYVRTFTPEKTVSYENLVKLMYRTQCRNYRFGDDTPLKMDIVAYYEIPKSASKKKILSMLAGILMPMKKPDFDNIGKVVADSLNSIAYRDDCQIVDGRVRKAYSTHPRVVVTIQEAEPFGENIQNTKTGE